MDASEWLERKYLEWQLDRGGRKPVSEFAEFLGTSQPYISMVMNGDRTPSHEMIDQWAYKLDDYSIHEVMGYDKPDERRIQLRERAEKVLEIYDKLDEEGKDEFFQTFLEWVEDHGLKRVK